MSSAARTRLVRLIVRVAISSLTLVLFALHVAGAPRIEIIERVESYLYDARVRLTMPGTVDERIVIVDIDEASQAELGQWPWPRDTLAAIVDRLFDDYGVRVVGFDVLFAEAEETSAERLLDTLADGLVAASPELRRELESMRATIDANRRFAEALIARDVVTGFVFKDSVAYNEPESTGILPNPLVPEEAIAAITVPFITARGFTGNLPGLQENAADGGFFDAPLIDADGVFRRAPLVQRYRGDLYASLALAVARLALDTPPVSFEFAGPTDGAKSGLNLEAMRLGDIRIPVDERVSVFIPYRGPQESFPFISAMDVLSGSAPAEALADRIVLVGASAAGLLDLRSTPVGQRYIGVEAHANLVAGLIDGAIRQMPSYAPGLELAMLALVAALTALILPRLGPAAALGFLLLVLGAVTAGNLLLWSRFDLVIPLASLLMYTLLASMLQITYGFFVEQRNKRHLSQAFGQYIPPSLVEEIDETGEEISMEGESREMSVLFSDVRGFTTISEGLDPNELTRMMNEFLTPFTRVIQQQRGTIDKYMGDCVMAFWGAPLADEQHASHAILAAFEMLGAVHDMDERFEARGWPAIRVGVGIASGIMNVGNMGSEFRIAYTVMGDTVNLGSRLEGLTKGYGVDIIVNDRTRVLAPEFLYRELDLVRVKGKREPVAIFEPLGLQGAVDAETTAELVEYEQALDAYRRRDFKTAGRTFENLKQRTDCVLYTVYTERIRRFREAPPPADWDGVFEHTSK